MKMRFPLSFKVLGWLLLNLLFLGLVLYGFFRVQFRFGLDSLLMGRAGDRLQAVAELISAELNETPRSGWSSVLERFSEAYRIKFFLFLPDGAQVAGEKIELPPAVRTRLPDRAAPGPLRRLPFRRMPFSQGPPEAPLPPEPPPPTHERPASINPLPPRQEEEPSDAPRPAIPSLSPEQRALPPWLRSQIPPDPLASPGEREGVRGRIFADPLASPGEREGVRGRVQGPRALHVQTPALFPKWMVHTANPSRYWVIMRIPLQAFGPPRPVPVSLVASSDSIRGGGLFFEIGPWMVVGIGVLLCSILFWFPLVRGITRTISQMTRATEEIACGRFDVRVNENRRDELGSLGQAVNRMASRLSGFVRGQKRFLGDIAHELCSPIARIQMALGILEERGGEKERAYLQDLREEVEHMSNLVNELLSFSKAGIRPEKITLQTVSVRPLLDRVISREALDPENVLLDAPEEARVKADPELLARALANLLRNAVRYAGAAGPVEIKVQSEGDRVRILIADSGPGIPAAALPQIFDPFFRPEADRARETGGAGLGLSIVKTCIEACQGSVTLRNRETRGLEAEVKLHRA